MPALQWSIPPWEVSAEAAEACAAGAHTHPLFRITLSTIYGIRWFNAGLQ
jgi:hypothetical protein